METIFKEIPSSKGGTYSVRLVFDEEGNLLLSNSNCTCIFGSFFQYAGFWKKRNKICRHMIKAIQEVKNEKKNRKAKKEK